MENFNYSKHYNIDAEKFNYFGERYGATSHDEKRVHQFIISHVPKETESILDVGCGSAWVAEYFTKMNKKVISLDISKVNPLKAINKFPNNNHFGITADSYKLPFPDSSVDCIIASEIIEHTLYPDMFIKELLRVLKPGHKLLVSTPYKEIIRYTLCIHCNEQTPMHAHLHSFDENSLGSFYKGKNPDNFYWITFGNKGLIFLRTYKILKYFSFPLWKFIDRITNLIYNIPAHILAVYGKD